VLRPDQYEIATSPAKRKVVNMGRRWGKTILGGTLASIVACAGGAVAWVVPIYANASPLWRFLLKATGPGQRNGLVSINKNEHAVSFAGGGYVQIFSADRDVAMRGNAFHLVVVDEAAQVSEVTHEEVILPTLADHDGVEVLISTPKGRTWYFDEYTRAAGDRSGLRSAWNAPSSANPHPNIRKAFHEAQRNCSAKTFRQEWLAEFIDDGEVFSNINRCLRPVELPVGGQLVFGIDWAREEDFTVVVGFNPWSDGSIKGGSAKTLYRATRKPYAEQLQQIRGLVAHYKPARIIAERNSMGGPLVEQLRNDLKGTGTEVAGFVTSAESKGRIVDMLALAFERETVRVSETDQALISELHCFTSRRRQDGSLWYGAPIGRHDDTVIALALAHAIGVTGGRGEVRGWCKAA
jgi:hypothetical protein